MTKNVYTVGQVNSYIKNMFTQDFMMNRIYVKGEVSNCKYHTTGHIYFTLKDETGALQAVLFAGNRKGLAFSMKNGDNVIVLGSISVYERDGKYQLYAREILLDGEGLLYQRFERLKRDLEEMGMFAPEYKQPIPKYIHILGIVTAPTGAAIRDIQNISSRRNPYVQTILYPALVQGEGAAVSIVNGIHALEQLGVDVMIVGRGGGSMEDLWAFNEEIVARAIFECSIPIISAVGHETDTTIADYTADMRAPTPSAAAELAVYDIRELEGTLLSLQLELNRNITDRLERAEERVRQYANRLKLLSPVNQLNEKRQTAADLEEKLRMRMEQQVMQRRHELELLAERLESLSPLKKLSQGYAFVTDKNGQGICDAEKVQTGDTLKIHMLNGKVTAKVEEVEQEVL
ncbi:exodeoxyribonuclease VII large subunit [Petralouisia muris]|jgi:exodeoxyribonuclease VII large subunit|uniref:Exodeoxyribonuclease VII large subunit n=1 Tax=Petralouisia muris TaxID=3032872 RepID=A0AC61RUS5_9FIRM|nr:exodeoxyribonuclease VII large subunit [Petralouisia muris]TGY95456.1 exodeoxyribonuclease VII large subunit [Petralouisia muris]